MSRILMQYVGKINGIDAYAPMDKEDADLIQGKTMLCLDLKAEKCLRTEAQNRSIHLYCKMLAEAFNAAGYGVCYVLKVLSGREDFPWEMLTVKDRLWRKVQIHALDKKSTKALTTEEVSMVYDALNRTTGEKLGVSVNFPDKYMKAYEQEARRNQ